jgi:hypothetical protein
MVQIFSSGALQFYIVAKERSKRKAVSSFSTVRFFTGDCSKESSNAENQQRALAKISGASEVLPGNQEFLPGAWHFFLSNQEFLPGA